MEREEASLLQIMVWIDDRSRRSPAGHGDHPDLQPGGPARGDGGEHPRPGFSRIEYLVLDDGSTDDTASVVAHYGDRVRYLRHDNRGEAETVNRGFTEASGDLIAVVNSDDPVRPGFVSAMVQALEDHPEAVVAYPDWDIIDQSGRAVDVRRAPDHDFALMVVSNWCYVGPGAVMRRRLVDLIGGRNPEYRQVGDLASGSGPAFKGRSSTSRSPWPRRGSSGVRFDLRYEQGEGGGVCPGHGGFLSAAGSSGGFPWPAERSHGHGPPHRSPQVHVVATRPGAAVSHKILRLKPNLRSNHPSHPRSMKILLRTYLLPQEFDRFLLRRWMLFRHGREPSF